MMKTMRMMTMFALSLSALVVAGCGGFTGDTGEISLAESVRDAFASKDIGSLRDSFSDEQVNAMQIGYERGRKEFEAQSKKEQESELKNFNERMKEYDDDWEKLDLDTYAALSIEDTFNYRFYRYYAAKNFGERANGLQVVGYERGHRSNPEWGSATIEFANDYYDEDQTRRDQLTVKLEQRAGSWVITDITVNGFQPEKKEKKDDDE